VNDTPYSPKASPWAPLQGAVALAMGEVGFYLAPADRDPVFAQLPGGLQFFTLAALTLMIMGGVALFLYATLRAVPDRSEPTQPQDKP